MSTKDFLKHAKLDASFFNKTNASEALPGFMELHGSKFLKQANRNEQKITVKNKTFAPREAAIDENERVLFTNEVFSKISSEIHLKLKEGESARLRMLANNRCKQNPNGLVTQADIKEIYKTLGFNSKTACTLRKIASYSGNPEEYVTPEKRVEADRMATEKKENLIKTYVATSTSVNNPYNHGVANIGQIEQKFAEYVKDKIASGTFNFVPTIGIKTDDIELDKNANIKNASSMAIVSIPKHLNGDRLTVHVPMLIKEGNFIEPLVMAHKDDIHSFNVKELESIYWKN